MVEGDANDYSTHHGPFDDPPVGSIPTLISHVLCPDVQRAAIVLSETGLPFRRIDIDLANKPDGFLTLSPLGKTPVLVVYGTRFSNLQ